MPQINEPTTTLTNYIITVLTVIFAVRLFGVWHLSGELPVLLWIGGFGALGVSALAAGTKHGFQHKLSPRTVSVIWKLTMYMLGSSASFALATLLLAVFPVPLAWWLVAAVGVKLAVYVVWMTFHDEFIYAMLDYAPTMLVVMLLAVYAALTRISGGDYFWWIAGGVAITFLAAGVQRSKVSLHNYFNHNDLYHVIQMVALWMFYIGGRDLAMFPAV